MIRLIATFGLVEGDAEDGWTIYAERRKLGIGILIR